MTQLGREGNKLSTQAFLHHNPLFLRPFTRSICYNSSARLWLNTPLLRHSKAVLEALKEFGEDVTFQKAVNRQMAGGKVDYTVEIVKQVSVLCHAGLAMRWTMWARLFFSLSLAFTLVI